MNTLEKLDSAIDCQLGAIQHALAAGATGAVRNGCEALLGLTDAFRAAALAGAGDEPAQPAEAPVTPPQAAATVTAQPEADPAAPAGGDPNDPFAGM